jgi:hypothetical protein
MKQKDRTRLQLPTICLATLAAAWLAGAALPRGDAQTTATGPALRHGFINNLDAARQKPNERGLLVITFKGALPVAPTIILQSPNPRYVAKVHEASRTGFAFAVYRTMDCLRGDSNNPFDGPAAAKPVTDFQQADNLDIAWVAIAGEGG